MGMLVSCLCASKPDRWGMLQRSIIDFGRQTYKDRELIVAVSDPRYAEQIEGFAEARSVGRVRVIQRDQRDQSGLLTQAQAAARGDFIAVWDDDNLNSPERLLKQLERTTTAAVSFLDGALYMFYETSELYFSRFDQPAVPLSQRCAATTLLAPRDLMPPWPNLGRGQSSSSQLADSLSRRGVKSNVISGTTGLHLIGVRGDNARGYEFHRKAATLPLTLKIGDLTAGKDALSVLLDAYTWEPGEVIVTAGDGVQAFRYTGKQQWSPSSFYPIGDPKDGVVRTTEQVG